MECMCTMVWYVPFFCQSHDVISTLSLDAVHSHCHIKCKSVVDMRLPAGRVIGRFRRVRNHISATDVVIILLIVHFETPKGEIQFSNTKTTIDSPCSHPITIPWPLSYSQDASQPRCRPFSWHVSKSLESGLGTLLFYCLGLTCF